MENKHLQELLLQSLEHERGGVQVYETAVQSAVSEDLKREWTQYLSQTREDVQILEGVLQELDIDPERETPGRKIVRGLRASLVEAMRKSQKTGNPAAAQLVARECVVIAETKDRADWERLGRCADQLQGVQKDALREACIRRERRAALGDHGWSGIVARLARPAGAAAGVRRNN